MNATSAVQSAALIAFSAVATLAGCMDQQPQSQTPSSAASNAPQPSSDADYVIGVAPDDAEMNAAIAQARATAEDARIRFAAASRKDRDRWSVKWASPTVDDDVEHIWVSPINWSPFRVEGWLASEPVQELACGKKFGEIVSFPIEELSDWVCFTGPTPEPDMDGPFEGGYTMKVLRNRMNQP